ncbi:hypothetical protein AB3X52_18800 [Nocardioides sp. DS6]|uniref:Transcriptional regulator, AbiEi antitoxin, Type IV TA system n=1 Tax=Nocardioides eburneus TaxID=3231482 RepID=A0ABV3T391_9ACTN
MTESDDPRDSLVSSRVRRLEGGEPPHRDPALTRVRRGYFRPADVKLSISQAHRLRIFATADARATELIFTHASAAALWGAPQLAADLSDVHVTQPGRARRTTAGVRVHRAAIPDEHVITLANGLLVASRAWAAVQIAASGSLPGVLLPLDHLVREIAAERGQNHDEVIESLVGLVPRGSKGRARAERHLRFADARSGSAGESLSRGQMRLLEVPMPDLQVRFPRGDQPGDDVVDFDWPALDTFGEFDGEAKYFAAEFTQGRSAAEVLWDEKSREDRIRRHRPRGVRWGWKDALSRHRLARILAAAGIVPLRRTCE